MGCGCGRTSDNTVVQSPEQVIAEQQRLADERRALAEQEAQSQLTASANARS